MLQAPTLLRRLSLATYVLVSLATWQCRASGRPAFHAKKLSKLRQQYRGLAGTGRPPRARDSGAGRTARATAHDSQDGRATSVRPTGQTETPSLIDQLFPEESRRYAGAEVSNPREIPRLPLDPFPLPASKVSRSKKEDSQPITHYQQQLQRQMDTLGPQTSVLVLRNASKQLTEEDFRRLIPQGKHIEGWTLERGDILQVIPGRDLATLAQQNYYYLLFSSPLSAFTYQGHVTRMHKLVSAHTPSSLLSPIPPAPGTLMESLDANAVLEAYSLTPPMQSLHLRQLKPPLSPLVASIVRNRGYAAITNRADRSPFEVRLTLEGPQHSTVEVRNILRNSSKDRALSWGDAEINGVRVARWEPLRPAPSPQSQSLAAHVVARDDFKNRDFMKRDEEQQMQRDLEKARRTRRLQDPVYIVGFESRGQAQSFVQYWHRRPMELKDERRNDAEGREEGLTIAHAEMLW